MKHGIGPGAPAKFTAERVEAILNALRGGCTRTAAAGYADIERSTMNRWMLRDETFRVAVEKAESEAEARYTQVVFEATGKSWQAAAWWLERRRPADYARRDRLDVTVDVRAAAERLAGELDGVSAEELLAEAERIAMGER